MRFVGYIVLLIVGFCFGDLFDEIASVGRKELLSPTTKSLRVAVGINSCLDLIVQGKDLFASMNIASEAQDASVSDVETIESAEEFLNVFSFFYKREKAGERFVKNETLFKEIVSHAEKDGMFAVGGNAALMAQSLIRNNKKVSVLLGGIVREKMKALLPLDLDIVGPLEVRDDQVCSFIDFLQL